MCGIAGFVRFSSLGGPDLLIDTVRKMTDRLVHRGPDDSGVCIDTEAGIGLGHRRLSILDLSPEGRQPMASVSGRYVIVFNGEIYNFSQIRKELDNAAVTELNKQNLSSFNWRGHSDTEVALAAIEFWGLEGAVKRFGGMFAFALWDRKERILHLVRDRLGEKPIYYGRIGNVFTFASELSSLRAHPHWHGTIDRDALAQLMRHNYIPAPYCIYRDFSKVLPGTIISVKNDGTKILEKTYWSAKQIAEQGLANPFLGTENEAAASLHGLLKETISQQMVADVPLGAFLSGGIDSSLVVALMQEQCSKPIRTFTIGFNETGYDEAIYAKAVARHLGTDHTELYVTSEDALKIIPNLPLIYSEPFSDSSQIPTFLVSQMTRKHVTVSLSGDGGDELFGGYSRYQLVRDIWNIIKWLPKPARHILSRGLANLTISGLDKEFVFLAPIFNKYGRTGKLGDKIGKLSELLAADSLEMLNLDIISIWKNTGCLIPGSKEPLSAFTDRTRWADVSDSIHQLMFLDMISYLPDDILVKVDRAAMGVSLETRVPFLDHRIVEFAWRLPLSLKLRSGKGKLLLRQLLYKYVPRQLIERPKMGFAVPIETWLRGPLRGWAEELLDEKRLREESFFDPAPIRTKWAEHLSGRRNWQSHLWNVLMFQAWKESQ